MNNYCKYKVAWCKYCQQGWIEIFREIESNKFYVSCSECYLEWDHPESIKDQTKATFEEYGISVDPTDEEVEELGWTKYIVEN